MLPLRSKLIAHWKMNDSGATTAVIDSIHGYNGVWQHGNVSTDSVVGKVSQALSFDGTNDYMVVANDPAFNASSFSFCAWLKHNNTSVEWDRIISKKNEYTDSSGYEITLDSSNTDVLYVSGSSDSFATAELGVNWLASLWTHIVVIYRSNTVQVYCNGVSKTVTGNIAPIIRNNFSFCLGKITSEEATLWDGLMDDVRLYRGTLTQDQVDSIYNSGNGTEDEGGTITKISSLKNSTSLSI